MHGREFLEDQIERLRMDILIARTELEILQAAMNDPKLLEPGRDHWLCLVKAKKSETKVLMSPDRDQLLLTIQGAFSVIGIARSRYADAERGKIYAQIKISDSIKALHDRLDYFDPKNW